MTSDRALKRLEVKDLTIRMYLQRVGLYRSSSLAFSVERIFVELMTSDRKLKAFTEGSN